MQLSPDDLTSLAEIAITAAQKAGALIASYANKTVDVKHKSGGDTLASQVVTEVDVRCDEMIAEILQPTCDRYDLALLTEESTDSKARLEKDYFWCVDPMDGTLSFIESIPGYAVSIGLVSKSGAPLIGVVYDPVTHILYSAVKGQGAMRNGKPWKLSAAGQGEILTLVCDRGFIAKPYYAELHIALTSMAQKQGLSGLKVIEKNGAVLNACSVLENSPAVYLKCPKPEEGGGSLWDFAATAALFTEMGASVSDVHGQPLELNRADSTFMNHSGVLFSNEKSIATETQVLLAGMSLN